MLCCLLIWCLIVVWWFSRYLICGFGWLGGWLFVVIDCDLLGVGYCFLMVVGLIVVCC